MQRIRADRIKHILYYVLPFVVLALTIVLDQMSKAYFKSLYLENGTTVFIRNFLSFTYVVNTGAAWSFLAGVSWAQTFFKILTVVALCVFALMYFYAVKKGYNWLTYAIVLIVGGTIGNFIDRVAFSGVTDFILLTFIDFPVFNLADSFLTVGVIMFVVHYLFLDSDALFKKSSNVEDKKSENTTDMPNEVDDAE